MSLFLIPLTGVFLIFGFLWWCQNFSHIAKHIKNIPGPGYPIFGVFLDYLLTDKEKFFQNDRDRCAKFPKIFKMWMLYKASVFLQDPKDIEVILSSTTNLKKSLLYDNLHMWLGTGLLTSDGEKWKIRRKMLTPGFHFAILKNFLDVFNETTKGLLNELRKWENGTSINVVPLITEFTLQSMAETSMGTYLDLTKESNKKYKNAMLDFVEVVIRRFSKPWYNDENLFNLFPISTKAKKSVKILHEFTNNIIKERKRNFGGSYTTAKRLAMLDLLIKTQEENGSIDDEGIREEVDTFMFEGHDTTAVAICYMLLLLANNKQIQNEIRQEIIDVLGNQLPTYNDLQELSFTERCIKECLRLYPSVVLIGRTIQENVKIPSGYVIPKDCMVHIFIHDLHRNPELYPDPLKFDPDRFLSENVQKRHPFAYIPFSAGSRNCIGQRFAMLEMKAVLCGLLREYILEPMDRPEDLVFVQDLVLRSRDPIRIRFVNIDN